MFKSIVSTTTNDSKNTSRQVQYKCSTFQITHNDFIVTNVDMAMAKKVLNS